MTNPYQQYRQTAVSTAPPEKLILMLYAGGIKFLKQADEAICEKKLMEAGRLICKVQEITGELISSINPAAGEISNNLQSLYTYINGRLIEANLRKDRAIIREVTRMFEEFYQTWTKLINSPQSGQQAGGINLEG